MDLGESKRQTRSAFVNRATLYYYIFDELRAKVGAQEAERILSSAIRRRGADLGRKYADAAGASDFERLGKIFVSDSPCEGELFRPSVIETRQEGCTLSMSACPLVDAWRDLGLDDDTVALMCRIAAQIDFATFESVGLAVAFDETIGEGGTTCRLQLRRK